MLEKYINEAEMIESLQKLIQIPSVHSENGGKEAPFGENTVKALEYVLNLAKNMGFTTKNVDGYCGYIEFGSGEKMLGIIGHLDVVPEGEGWKYPPFSATIDGDEIYGRGSIDDKGPVMASLYAMKAVKDYIEENNINLGKRVRLILGLNEERDWKCIEYYKEHEEWPTFGFSPDADFPCIYAEKGIISPIINLDYSKYFEQKVKIKEIDCKNNPLNVVPKYARILLEINEISVEEFTNKVQEIVQEKGFNIDGMLKENLLELTSYGVQAHAAHPNLGVNAISQLVVVLNEVFKAYNIENPLFEAFEKYIGTEYNGEKLSINIPDESGELTLNVGNIKLTNDKIEIGLNLRVPINTKLEFIKEKFKELFGKYDLELDFIGIKEPLYVSKDSYLVKKLCEIFNRNTNLNEEPITIGGGTYARAFENFVSFGANLPGQKDMCHQVDEFITISNLKLAAKIYAETILELNEENF